MRSIFLRFIIVCPLALTLSAPVAAQAGPPGRSDVVTDKARELHMEADALYKQGQYARARASYIAAWALKQHWQIAGNLGETEVQLGLYRDAAEHLAYFMRNLPDPSSPDGSERMTVAKKLYQKARSNIGTLNVSVDVAGAEIVVDGKIAGKAPLEDPVFVDPGHHTIEARLGAKLATAEVDVTAGAERSVPITLAAPPTPRGPSVPVIVAGSTVAGVALVTGIGLLAGAASKSPSVQSQSAAITAAGHTCAEGAASYDARCDDLHSTAAAGDRMNRAGIGLLVGAGVVGAGTLIYALVPRTAAPSRSAALRVAPALSPGYSGLSFSGTF
jgi:hypothetical protein